MSRNRRIYIGKLSQRTRDRDIEDTFSKYGKINAVDLKRGYAFVEFDDERDADDAIRAMDGNELDGARIVVEASHGGRDRSERRGGPGSDECFSCGGRGHWARDCPSSRGSRRGGGGGGSGGGGGGGGRYRSRSRSPRRGGDRYNSRRSRSRSPSPRKGRDSRSQSPDRAPKTDTDKDNNNRARSRSPAPAKAASRSVSPKRDRAASASPRKENGNDKNKSPAQDD